jgi:hypothetical protein
MFYQPRERVQHMKVQLLELKAEYKRDPSSLQLKSTAEYASEYGVSTTTFRAALKTAWSPETPPKLPSVSQSKIRSQQLRATPADLGTDSERIFLLLDKFSAHCSEEVLKTAAELNIELIFIPAGLTNELQPLDVGINSVLKSKHSAMYRRNLLHNRGQKYKPEHALRDMIRLSHLLDPSVILKSWSKVLVAAKNRSLELQQQTARAIATTQEIPAHREDVCDFVDS